jgi:mannitol/fructose-specific phosphotransferase system IIA component (Ntr-type)
MRLTEILKPENIKVPLASTTKTEAIGELVNLLADNKAITDPKKVLDSVLDREATRTTGIGKGQGLPHGK